MKYVHTNIIARDWKLLTNFYINTFQCKLVPPIRKQSGKWLEDGTGLKNASLEGAHLLLPGHGEFGPTLEIYSYKNIDDQPSLPPNKRGFGHIAFEVDSVENIVSKVLENGGNLSGKITKRIIDDVGQITFVYARGRLTFQNNKLLI